MSEFERSGRYFYDPNKFLDIHEIRELLYVEDEVVCKLIPGITGVVLPVLVERLTGPCKEYSSTFDLLRVYKNISLGPSDGQPSIFIELQSITPACTAGDCPGCKGCMGLEILFDPASGVEDKRWQVLYSISERQMRSGNERYRTIVDFMHLEGQIAVPQELIDQRQAFKQIADDLYQKITAQTIIPIDTSEWPE